MPMADRLPQQGTPLCDLPADSASALGLGSGDLCIPYRRIHDGSWGYLWGDSWRGPGRTGEYLGSPVMSTQDVFDASGANSIRFTGAVPGGRVRQLFDYATDADNGFGVTEVSRIPNDALEIDGRTFIQYTAVHSRVRPDSAIDGSAFSSHGASRACPRSTGVTSTRVRWHPRT
ncbi:DUF4185 domain-containing protein [Nocardia rhamnosiphila]|uniref:DUF4185 domain-containing protein n=1 Tax=Nocardia rhamnosiphila TaxID=426716 RepID=A0ABV2WQE4_9NOCA